jgi:ribosomal protein S18 acetylase RimI-like enzyme
MGNDDVRCGPIRETARERMALVIESAFAEKLEPVLPVRVSRLRVLASGTDVGAVIGAYVGDHLVGVVGLKTRTVSVFQPLTFQLLRREVGAGAIKAKLALALLERPIEPGTIRIEFLAVAKEARGGGVGRALLHAVEGKACGEKLALIELHVEAANDDARRLYERAGFRQATMQREPAPRRWLLGQSDIRMIKEPLCTTC